MIRIIIDSSSDFQKEDMKRMNLEHVPIAVTVDDKTYMDGVDLDSDLFYQLLSESKSFPKTAQPSPQAFLDIFEDAKEHGDDVICILLSSALSGTCQSATIAKSMANYENIHIIDSLSATLAIRIMVTYACDLREKGLSAIDIVKAVEDMKSRTKILIALDTLEYLYKGGRLSKTAAVVGELASMKPMITVVKEGSLQVIGKFIGKNKTISGLLKFMQNDTPDEAFPLYSLYTNGTANTEILEKRLLAENITPDQRLQIGPTIGAHLGPGAFGVIYVTK